MIIYVNLPVETIEQLDVNTCNEFLDLLRHVYKLGIHVVVMHRDCCKAFKLKLTGLQAKFCEILDQKFSLDGGLANQPYNVLTLSQLEGGITKVGDCFSIGLSEFLVSEISQRPELLVENAYADGKIYKALIKFAAFQARLPVYNVSLAHGGGDDICKVFEGKIEERKAIACLVDSDKKSPEDKTGGKCSKIQALINNSSEAIATFDVLPCHEIENVIPLDCLVRLKGLSGDQISTFSKLLTIDRKQEAAKVPTHQRYRLYFDHDKGLSPELYEAFGEEVRAYVQTALGLAGFNPTTCTLTGAGKALPVMVVGDEVRHILLSSLKACGFWREIFREIFTRLACFFASRGPLAAI